MNAELSSTPSGASALATIPSDIRPTSLWYDRFSSFYDLALERLYLASRRELGRRVGTERGRTLVDLCCGTGANLPHIASAIAGGGRLVAIDASSGMLKKAEARASKLGITNADFVHADARRLADAAFRQEHRIESIDGLVCSLGLSVVPEWEAVFDAARSIVRPGGRFVVMDGRTLRRALAILNPILVAELRLVAHADVRRPIEEQVVASVGGEPVARFLLGHIFVAGGATIRS